LEVAAAGVAVDVDERFHAAGFAVEPEA
jgi:hypothetical protein